MAIDQKSLGHGHTCNMMGLSGPNFCIVLLAWKCDETNFKLLLRIFFKIYFSSDFSQISNYFKKMNNIITTEPFRRIAYSLFYHITCYRLLIFGGVKFF